MVSLLMVLALIAIVVACYVHMITHKACINITNNSSVKQKLCTLVADVGIPLLVEQLKTISIPTISGKFDTPVGHVSYDLSKLVIIHFYFQILP